VPAEQAHHTLRPFVASLVVGDPISHLNLTIIPLRGNGQAPIDYVLGADAIEAGTLTVTEISEGGSVPELLVTSTTDQMVLSKDGGGTYPPPSQWGVTRRPGFGPEKAGM